MLVMTSRYKPVLFPNLFGDIKVLYAENHTFGLGFDSTSNIIFNTAPTQTGFFYSDYSLFYKFRILGSPLRPPQIPVIPPYSTVRYTPRPPANAFGKPTSLEVGVRVHQTVLRGFGNEPIDAELARAFTGASLLLSASQAVGPLRVHGALEAGHSIAQGNITSMGFEAAVTYERFASISPGIQLKVTNLSGTPDSDPYDGVPLMGRLGPIENRLIFLGAIIHFKL